MKLMRAILWSYYLVVNDSSDVKLMSLLSSFYVVGNDSSDVKLMRAFCRAFML